MGPQNHVTSSMNLSLVETRMRTQLNDRPFVCMIRQRSYKARVDSGLVRAELAQLRAGWG